ncbi:hypothetical protein [Thermus scotoductus]|uniref:hypothetical protein n=1 Tax=Thermus scotoductus TaxID=37636 RepID=UPI000F8073DF|nr:hypothetical protein [Thermus scotoductus]RTI41098.1 hypothetical protein CSW16_02795 [Thermus scotoductus]
MEKIFGKTEGLKKSELKRLSNLYRRRIPKERVLTPELAQVLAGLSQEVGRASPPPGNARPRHGPARW